MKILAHRGWHDDTTPPNSLAALAKALSNGYGIETDFRDYKGELVLSHDIADESSVSVENLFAKIGEQSGCVAINIKADGLLGLLRRALTEYNVQNYFAFDMSVPQTVEYAEAGLRFFTRRSEYETEPVLYERAAGVWVDAFYDDSFINESLLQKFLSDGKEVCIVSPELHRRDEERLWSRIKAMSSATDKLYLCTDKPEKVDEFFNDR